MRHGFRRRRDGRITLTLEQQEVDVLRAVTNDVATVVAAPPDRALEQRLYPRAYLDPTEESAEAEFRSLVHDDLAQSRRDALVAIGEGLDAATRARSGMVELVLEPGREIAWLTALNDARLVIGTMLGVTEDEPLQFAQDDPRFTQALVYDWLSGLQQELVECLSGELGTEGTE